MGTLRMARQLIPLPRCARGHSLRHFWLRLFVGLRDDWLRFHWSVGENFDRVRAADLLQRRPKFAIGPDLRWNIQDNGKIARKLQPKPDLGVAGLVLEQLLQRSHRFATAISAQPYLDRNERGQRYARHFKRDDFLN